MKMIFVRNTAHGVRLIITCLAACTLMFIDHNYKQFNVVRASCSILVLPLKKVVDTPFSLANRFGSFISRQQYLFNENFLLKQERLLYLGKLQKLAALEKENSHLRELLQSGSEVTDDMFIANIINIDPDPFTHQFIIDKGKRDGVFEGQTIIDAEGIMGSIITVDDSESRAMLISDASHAVPVENVRNGIRAIAVGTGGGNLELRHVPKSADINEGDVLISSGIGGRFPVGFPVGKVTDVKRDRGKPFATVVLQPIAKLDRGSHVLLIRNANAKREKQVDNNEI